MVRARDIMSPRIVSVSPETGIPEAARVLLENHYNGVPVIDQKERLVGIICQEDLIVQQKKLPLPSFFTLLDGVIPLTSPRHLDQEMQKMAATTVGQAMTPNPVTIDPETPLEEIATLMVTKNIHTLPVVERGKVVGIVGKEDILRTLMPRTG
jgi:CBS-domain-containing membrane protein